MAYPIIEESLTRAFPVADTTHNVVMPTTVNSGELLLMHCATFGTGGDGIVTPTGWTLLGVYSTLSSNGQVVYRKLADGTEGGTTVIVDNGNTGSAVFVIQRISGWAGTLLTDVEITAAEAIPVATITPDPPSITASWGADDNLFIAAFASSNDDESVSIYPSGWADNNVSAITGAGLDLGVSLGLASLESTLATQDPGVFTLDETGYVRSATIVIKPLAGAVVPLLTLPTATAVSSSELSGTVTTDGLGNGTLYWYVDNDITPPVLVADLKAGTGSVAFGSQAVSTTGLQTISSMPGLTASTAYYVHYVHTDSVGDSLISTTAQVTTNAQVASITILGIGNGESLINLDYLVLDSHDLSVGAVLDNGSGATTNTSGDLTLDLTGITVSNGDPLLIILGNWTTTPDAASIAAVCYGNAVVV